ncbi:MAG TPA: DinB family protein [Ignavibacteriales bacterium]|nr:DinB family protein [Ignavibacteriales bacterium]
MKEYFIKLFRYNEWANNQVLEAFMQPLENSDEVTRLFSHIISVQKLWLDRIRNNKIIFEFWNNDSIEGCIKISKESSSDWLKFLEALTEEGFSEKISYVNSKGEHYQNTVEDILSHVINHSTYHRAQIAMLLRKADAVPPVTDYVFYRR